MDCHDSANNYEALGEGPILRADHFFENCPSISESIVDAEFLLRTGLKLDLKVRKDDCRVIMVENDYRRHLAGMLAVKFNLRVLTVGRA